MRVNGCRAQFSAVEGLETESRWRGIYVQSLAGGLALLAWIEHKRLELHLSVAELAQRHIWKLAAVHRASPARLALPCVERKRRDLELIASLAACPCTSLFRHELPPCICQYSAPMVFSCFPIMRPVFV
jgi:hypothetical protein